MTFEILIGQIAKARYKDQFPELFKKSTFYVL